MKNEEGSFTSCFGQIRLYEHYAECGFLPCSMRGIIQKSGYLGIRKHKYVINSTITQALKQFPQQVQGGRVEKNA